MPNSFETQFHSSRRAFIIFEGIGIFLMEPGSPMSHFEALQALGLPPITVEKLFDSSPRGYFKNGSLMLYQGDFEPLDAHNIEVVKRYLNDLKTLFSMKDDGPVFSGFSNKEPGTEWPPLKELHFN